MPASYGQFCPVAKASEFFAERWTPLVLRELLCGSHRFNEIRRGVPLMSRSLLSKRLGELERAGVVERRKPDGLHHHEYHLTPAGEELRPIIEGLGAWGQRWVVSDLDEDDLDPKLLMWDISRCLRCEGLERDRIVVRFDFRDVEGPEGHWWLLVQPGGGDLCMTDPGFPVDLTVRSRIRDLTLYWMGRRSWRELLGAEGFELVGPTWIQREVPEWLGQGSFADLEMPELEAAGTESPEPS